MTASTPRPQQQQVNDDNDEDDGDDGDITEDDGLRDLERKKLELEIVVLLARLIDWITGLLVGAEVVLRLLELL